LPLIDTDGLYWEGVVVGQFSRETPRHPQCTPHNDVNMDKRIVLTSFDVSLCLLLGEDALHTVP
jgi:hypothetical protein